MGGQVRVRKGLVVLVVMLLLAAACGGDDDDDAAAGGDDGELQSVSLVMSTDSIAVPGPWVADILGFYEEEGLDVDITPTGGSSEAVQLGITRDFDIIYAFNDAILSGIAENKEALYPFMTYFLQEFREWSVPADSDIASIEDLKGTTLGLAHGQSGGEYLIALYFLEQAGLVANEDIELVDVGDEPASIVAAFEAGRIDSYVSTEQQAIGMEAQGFELNSIFPDTLRSGPIEGFVARESNKDDSDMLAAFGRATAKATLFCITDAAACVDVIASEYPERVEDRDLAIDLIKRFAPDWTPPEEDGRLRFQVPDADGWETYLEIYSVGEEPIVTNPDDVPIGDYVSAVATDDLEEAINDFDYDAVVKLAEEHTAE